MHVGAHSWLPSGSIISHYFPERKVVCCCSGPKFGAGIFWSPMLATNPFTNLLSSYPSRWRHIPYLPLASRLVSYRRIYLSMISQYIHYRCCILLLQGPLYSIFRTHVTHVESNKKKSGKVLFPFKSMIDLFQSFCVAPARQCYLHGHQLSRRIRSRLNVSL